MPYVVIEVATPGARRDQVRSFGTYATEGEAEQARRRRHLDNLAKSKWTQPRTYVAEIEEAI